MSIEQVFDKEIIKSILRDNQKLKIALKNLEGEKIINKRRLDVASRKPYKIRWFYGYGPNGEMIIDNNQNEVAGIYDLNQGEISACLRGKCPQHKGWRFTLIENTCRPKKVKQEPTPKEKEEADARHIDTATAARIRNLMYTLYPQWGGVEADGSIFTSY